MKSLAVILGLMIAAQPIQAGDCDMEEAGDALQHAGMLHDSGDSDSEHSCCQSPDTGDGKDCANSPQCAPCTGATAVVPSVAAVPTPAPEQHDVPVNAGPLAPSHTAPPFRPPKTIS
jgi:hypothetical protein